MWIWESLDGPGRAWDSTKVERKTLREFEAAVELPFYRYGPETWKAG